MNIHTSGGKRKINELLDLITGQNSFGSNNLKQTYRVAAQCAGGVLDITDVLQLRYILRLCDVKSSVVWTPRSYSLSVVGDNDMW